MKIFILLIALCLTRPLAARAAPPQAIWDTRTGQTITEAALLDRLAQADVVFLGEQHNDAATHRLELRVLEGLYARTGPRLTLGMEMFERDTQSAMDAYLAGKTTEAQFLKASRPWANYRTDYRPLVEYAKARRIPVVAANAPQALVAQVGQGGLAVLDKAPPGLVAVPQFTPHDAYWQRFHAFMTQMGGAHDRGMAMDDAATERFYEAQCVWDTTMADSINQALQAHPHGLVLHVNGQFHSDYGGGTPRRLLWERPLTHVVVVSVVPVATLPAAVPPKDRGRGDFVVYERVQ
jgi:uncharacterized iron-regulated protein